MQVGLTNRQALAAATGNFPALFRWPRFGRLKPGFRADVLVLDANPLTDIKNLKRIRHLFVRGQLVDREQLLGP
jgi:imidazolonepropionase-like amidohydrolase